MTMLVILAALASAVVAAGLAFLLWHINRAGAEPSRREAGSAGGDAGLVAASSHDRTHDSSGAGGDSGGEGGGK